MEVLPKSLKMCIRDRAKQGLDHDDKGYRREFVRLVEAVKGIQQEK